MFEQNYSRLLQILSNKKVQFRTPIGLVMLSAKTREKEKIFTLKFSAKPEVEVQHATLTMAKHGDQIKIEKLEGLDAIIIKNSKEVPNPMSSNGVGTFLVNSLILVLQDIFDGELIIGGILNKPKFPELEPLAARRDFWRNFGFQVDGYSGRDSVVGKLKNLHIYKRPLFGSELLKGKNLLDQHLM